MRASDLLPQAQQQPAPAEAARLAAATVPPTRWRRLRMWQRFFLAQGLIFTVLMLGLAAVQYTSLAARTRQEYGDRALMLSRTVANMPQVSTYFSQPDTPIRLDPLLEKTRQDIGADFLVVGGRLGMRYAHPFPPMLARRISQAGPDDVLAGGDPVEVGKEQFKDFIWGKAEIPGAGGQSIGVVSTGFLLPTVQAGIQRVMRGLLPWYTLGLLFALAGSLIVSGRLRRDLFDLEPDQISGLVSQHHAVLTALQDGVLVLQGEQVILANQRALECLHVANLARLAPVSVFWPELHHLLSSEGQAEFRERPGVWQRQPMLISRYPLPGGRQLVLFRERAEAVRLAEELTQARQYVDVLRAQTHEFTNRLHTIAGLIQINRADMALDIIGREADQAQRVSDQVRSIQPPRLAALLAGKIARARELGVEFNVDEASALEDHWPENVIDALVLSLGNLAENAFDAVTGPPQSSVNPPNVTVMLGEDSEGLQLEVRDNGPGLPAELLPRLFQRGFTTKGAGRGQGLTLVGQQLLSVGGQLEHLRTQDETVFIVSIPRSPEGTS